MWSIDDSDEVKLYFLDNGALAFGLLIKLAELMVSPDGLPPDNYPKAKNGLIQWEIQDHVLFYKRVLDKQQLVVAVIKPL